MSGSEKNNWTPEYQKISDDVILWAKETLKQSDYYDKKFIEERIDKISPKTKCEEFVGDSLDLLEAVLELEEKFDINIDEEPSMRSNLEKITDVISDLKRVQKHKETPVCVKKKTLSERIKNIFQKTRQ